MTDIDHATAAELYTLMSDANLTYADMLVLENALITVSYIMHLLDKAIRSEDIEMQNILEEILKHE